MKTLKLNSRGHEVKQLQALLNIIQDGIFGQQTSHAVMQFQLENNLKIDGIVGPLTWSLLLSANKQHTTNQSPLWETYYLTEDAYFSNPTPKKWIFLHHTRGWENPYRVIDSWASNPVRKVATEFVVGGQNIENTTSQHDGKILQAFPSGRRGWHLGIGNNAMHRESVGIELCSFGELTKGHITKTQSGVKRTIQLDPNKVYTFTGREVHPKQIVSTSETFRGFDYFHKYSDLQILALKQLLFFIAKRDNIDIRSGLPALIRKEGSKAFAKLDRTICQNEPGIWSHSNLQSFKRDVAPQENLIQMLTEI
jgi:N-acetyl-anhydromuramyl-L-alanine amidase AmpD